MIFILFLALFCMMPIQAMQPQNIQFVDIAQARARMHDQQLLHKARKTPLNTLNIQPELETLAVMRVAKRGNGKHDHEIGDFAISSAKIAAENDETYQLRLLKRKVKNNPYAQAKFKALPLVTALDIADDAKDLSEKSKIPVDQAYLLNKNNRALCHTIVDTTETVGKIPNQDHIVHVDTETYNKIVSLPPHIRKGLGLDTLIVVDRTFEEGLQYVGTLTTLGAMSGAIIGGSVGALNTVPEQFINSENAKQIAAVAVHSGLKGAYNGVMNNISSPEGQRALQQYALTAQDTPFGQLVPNPPAIITVADMVTGAKTEVMTAVPQEVATIVRNTPIKYDKEGMKKWAIIGGITGATGGFLLSLWNVRKPVWTAKMGQIGTEHNNHNNQ